MIETARKEEHLSINKACNILGISRTGYYRKVYGLIDYQKKQKKNHKGQVLRACCPNSDGI